MRLHLYLCPNERPVPFDYQHYLTGAFHKWLGANDLHDRLSLYSLSWLYEGRARGGALEFPRGAHWFLSFHDELLAEPLVNNALRDPEVCRGMRVVRIEQQATPRFGPCFTFKVGSPVLARSKEDGEGRVRHYLYSDREADAVLTATLRHKLDRAGLGAPHKPPPSASTRPTERRRPSSSPSKTSTTAPASAPSPSKALLKPSPLPGTSASATARAAGSEVCSNYFCELKAL